jgi:flavin reductase (DIM6/NTAB) family NADH-FMN oxidoreductase RutF
MTAGRDAGLDQRALRDAFGCFLTGVTVVTARGPGGAPLGFTANSFTSLSLDPPLLLVAISNRSANLPAFAGGPGFAVNILAEDQREVAATFSRPVPDRFASVRWFPGPGGAPILAGVSAWFDCRLEQALPAGDHTLLIGRIEAFEHSPRPGLGYYRGGYVTQALTAAQLPAGPEVVVAALFEAGGRVLLVDDGRGGATLPMARVGRNGVRAALSALIAEHGVEAEPGMLYAVFEDTRLGTQNLAIRCPVATARATRGAFVELSPAALDDLSDPAQRAMLERLADEARLGRYGVYFGTHERGIVQRPGGGEGVPGTEAAR